MVKATTVKQATFDLLRAFGIKRVFGNPGSTELPFLSDWPDDIDYVLGLQEASVVGMADGYAQATRNAGFVNLHSAAGVGNALGNVYTAHRNQTPLVITAGQQARSILPLQAFLQAERAQQANVACLTVTDLPVDFAGLRVKGIQSWERFSAALYSVIPGWCVSNRPQMRNCASGNLEIPGSMLRIAPE